MGASRAKRIGIVAGTLLLAVLLFTFSARRFLFHPHLDIVPIAQSAEYRDEAKLHRAFAMAVAASYEHPSIVYQSNGSLCGPTSLANVARSLGEPQATATTILEGSGKCRFGICF